MTFAAEAQILREIGKFLMNGGLFRGSKPVLWSVVEKTALAEAEVEYHDHVSNTIYVAFPVRTSADPIFGGASAVIWTTTPWTIPGNRAIAYGEAIDYVLLQVDAVARGQQGRARRQADPGQGAARAFAAATGITESSMLWSGPGSRLAGIVCHHPLAPAGAMISPCRCCRAASSPPSRAPASSISRPAMAPTTGRLRRAYRRRGAADGGWRRPLLRSCAAVSPASGS